MFYLPGHPKIIHRDIKSANILLDDEYEAQAIMKSPFLYTHLMTLKVLVNETCSGSCFVFLVFRLLILDLLDSMIQHKLTFQLGLWEPSGKQTFITSSTPKLDLIDPMPDDKFVIFGLRQQIGSKLNLY